MKDYTSKGLPCGKGCRSIWLGGRGSVSISKAALSGLGPCEAGRRWGRPNMSLSQSWDLWLLKAQILAGPHPWSAMRGLAGAHAHFCNMPVGAAGPGPHSDRQLRMMRGAEVLVVVSFVSRSILQEVGPRFSVSFLVQSLTDRVTSPPGLCRTEEFWGFPVGASG